MATNKVRTYVRDPATGSGINGVTVSLKRHNGGGTVTTDATDANGLAEFDHDTVGYPGPAYVQMTSGSTTDVQSGNVVGQIAGLLWAADIPDVFALLGIGVVTGLQASGGGGDMDIDVSAGMALLKDGLPYIQEATKSVTIGTADATNPRIDRVVLRLTREGQTDQGKIALDVVAGTPAGSPAAPALTQTAATWEFSLAQVSVLAGVTSIAADKVTDERYSTSLSQARTFVYPTGLTKGDILYLDANGALARLAVGSTSDLLTVASGLPAWASNVAVTGALAVTGSISTSANANLGDSASDTTTVYRLATAGGTPTFTAGAAMGTSPGSQSKTGDDTCCTIIQNAGTSTTTGVLWSVAFASARSSSGYRVFLTSLGGVAADCHPYVTNRATTGFDIACRVAPTASTQMAVCFLVIQ